jgi:hypothetical protein
LQQKIRVKFGSAWNMAWVRWWTPVD